MKKVSRGRKPDIVGEGGAFPTDKVADCPERVWIKARTPKGFSRPRPMETDLLEPVHKEARFSLTSICRGELRI
jgi:hypothetical protein